jgi:hypothetical protein
MHLKPVKAAEGFCHRGKELRMNPENAARRGEHQHRVSTPP